MKLSIKTIFNAAILSTLIFGFSSCQTIPEIPEDMSAQEMIQNGQSAYEDGKNKVALAYFNEVVARYGDNPALYVEARYEIGHLYMKKKDYKNAVPVLEEIRDIYPQVQPGTLPGAYEKLANLELAKVPAAELEKIHEKNGE